MNKLKIWNILENKTDNKITRVFNNIMILIISLNIIAFILETEKDFYKSYKLYFYWFEIISIGIFTIEYIHVMLKINIKLNLEGCITFLLLWH